MLSARSSQYRYMMSGRLLQHDVLVLATCVHPLAEGLNKSCVVLSKREVDSSVGASSGSF